MDDSFPREFNAQFRAFVDWTMARSSENDKRSDRPSIKVKDKFCGAREALSPTTGMSSPASAHGARSVKLSLNYSFDLQIGFSPRSKVEEDLKFSNETMKCEAKG
jgi:hypothetical protein